ncbi:MAG: sigma 54-interacting transcriptional regulator [Candidatus Hydrogenedentota bacterium]
MARVLIVEDEPVLRMTFQEFLREDGYETDAVASFNEAKKRVDDDSYDIVVSDIILGGRTGIDLLRHIHEQGMRSAVIMITGDPSIQTASDAVRNGAYDYIAKPVNGETLKKVVRQALERKKLAEERDAYAARMAQYRAELDAIFNSVNAAIVTVDSSLRLRHANESAKQWFALDERIMEGERIRELLPEWLGPAIDALEKSLTKGQSFQDIRLEGPGGDGGHRVLVASTTPLEAQQGSGRGAVFVARDITRLTQLEAGADGQDLRFKITGKSRRMREIYSLIEDLRETDSTVLICGESGTGKELVAEAIHENSSRAGGPFVKVNCAALSEDILESELFGHVKGAFTGAIKDRTGRFELANGGTILLDEIGDISPRLQLRLLRVLQQGEFEPVGDSRSIRTNARVIAATNRDLVARIHAGEFRQDLYYRLNVVRIDVPPLRERREDIPLLVEYFCRRFNSAMKKEISGLAPDSLDIFMKYPWPGNVRELENCMERAFIVCREPWILPRHLPPELGQANGHAHYAPAPAIPTEGTRDLGPDQIVAVLIQTDWNVAKAARRLGVARNTLYMKMKQFELRRPNE